MAEAIPTADPALLAAQAKAGQAGVDAYNAAISTLQSQKQSAVQTAMQEAALRGGPAGAPAGAAQSQAGIINAPYDQRIASLTQNLGGYQADQSARTQRMDAYNNAVLAARSYIPQVTEQTVAPIRAQADYNVRNTEMQGQQNVAGINADTELTMAKMAAAFQAAQIQAAKAKAAAAAKAKTLNVGELSGLMTQRAGSMLSDSGAKIGQILSANEADIAKQVQSKAASSTAKSTADAARNQSYWDLMGAAYSGKGILEDKQKLSAQIKAAAGTATTSAATGSPDSDLAQARAAMAQQAAVNAQQFNPMAPPVSSVTGQVASNAPSFEQLLAKFMPASRYKAAQSQVSQLANRAGDLSKVRDAAGGQYFNEVIGSLGAANKQYSAIDPTTQRRVLMTPQQAEGLDPFTREMVMGGTQTAGINGPEDFQRLVMGSPQDDINAIAADPTAVTNQGVGSPYSSEVVRNAMVEVATQLQKQGYNIQPEDVANALPNEIPSIYNLLAKQNAQPSSEDAFKSASQLATKAQAAATKNDTVTGKGNEAAAAEGLMNQYGSKPPTNLGSAVQVLTRLNDNKDTVDQGKQALADIVKNWDQSKAMTPAAVTAKLRAAGVASNIIPLVLYVSGF
jgi:hypothetical protein